MFTKLLPRKEYVFSMDSIQILAFFTNFMMKKVAILRAHVKTWCAGVKNLFFVKY